MNKTELKHENEDLYFELKELNLRNNELVAEFDQLILKKFALKCAGGNLQIAKEIYDWLNEKENHNMIVTSTGTGQITWVNE